MNLGQLETLFWAANIAVTAWLIVVMLRQQLRTTYPALFGYLVVDFIQQAIGISVVAAGRFAGPLYFIVYSVGQTLKLAIAGWILVELARRTLAQYPALAKFAARMSYRALLGSVLLSGVWLYFTPPHLTAGGGWALPFFLAFERSLDLCLIVLLLALCGFIGWFPIRLPRNAAFYLGGYFTFFLIRWVGNNVQNFTVSYRTHLSAAMLGCAAVCLGSLALWLKPRGEKEIVQPGHSWNPEAMVRLQRQVEAMNTSLSRARPEA